MRRPENKVELQFDKDYRVVYRIISENSEACSSPENLRTQIFPDNKSARITDVAQGIVAYTMDIKEIGRERTQVDLYMGFAVQKRFLPQRMSSWVIEGSKKCKLNGFPVFGPD